MIRVCISFPVPNVSRECKMWTVMTVIRWRATRRYCYYSIAISSLLYFPHVHSKQDPAFGLFVYVVAFKDKHELRTFGFTLGDWCWIPGEAVDFSRCTNNFSLPGMVHIEFKYCLHKQTVVYLTSWFRSFANCGRS